ncbi:MAG: glycoside hydrolase family 3 protein [Candidatus Eisenbacteria bacterium]
MTLPDVDSLVSSMSLEEKVGQLLIVGIEGHKLSDATSEFLSQGQFSGVILFRRNIVTVDDGRKLLRGLKALFPKERRPILAVDEEGGRITQIGHLLAAAPSAAKIGEARHQRSAFFYAKDTAQKLRWFGFNTVFAPVLDVNDEPRNPVIGDRSYGADVGVVEALGAAAVLGFKEGGVAPTGKHFPGHGSSTVDSHKALPVIRHAAERWYTFEFVPFRAAIESNVPLIMTGHIACPALTAKEDLPATFSPRVVREILRDEFKFDGIVITDALEMNAAATYMAGGHGPEEALKAGCDLLLFAHGGKPALEAKTRIVEAVRRKRLSEKDVEESLRRVLTFRMGLPRV